MDFTLPEELRMLKDNVRRYVDKHMIPNERMTLDGEELKPEWREKFQQGAKDLGIWMMEVPEEFGGPGLGIMPRVVVWEELARSIALPSRGESMMGPSVRAILFSLEGELREKYLFPVLRGEKRACFAQTEPEAGSDPGSMRTTAVRDGDDYVINGVKRYISHADKADFAQVMAATDRTKGSRGGISCFLVDMNTPGVKITTKYQTMMGDAPCEIVFDNVRVPATHRVGEEGEGFKFGQKWLGVGRIKHGARALGVAERCLEMAVSYAKQRVTFGKPLAERQAIQWMLADSAVDIATARAFMYETLRGVAAGLPPGIGPSICKLHCSEMVGRVADRAVQIHGGAGLVRGGLPIERFYRDIRHYRVGEGASEVQRMLIAKDLLQ